MNREQISKVVENLPGTGGRKDYVNNLMSVISILPKDSTILEIGSLCGGSALVISLCAMNKGLEHMYCIDPAFVKAEDRPEKYKKYSIGTYTLDMFKKGINDNNLQDIVTPLPGLSEEILNIWEQKYNKKFDLIYIDGDHTYDAMRIDIQWEKYAKDNAIILLDDWIKPTQQAVDEYFSTHPGWIVRKDHHFWPIYYVRGYLDNVHKRSKF